ncbi:MAG: CARDB domain-containing protein [Desulfurococcaceae archaeon]
MKLKSLMNIEQSMAVILSMLFLVALVLASIPTQQVIIEPSSNSIISVFSLTRSPKTVHSMQGVIIFAEVYGNISTINLSVTITLSLMRDGSVLLSESRTFDLPMLPIPFSPGWYFTSIPGLPAKTMRDIIYTWKILSHVNYSLIVNGAQIASGNYTVIEGEASYKPPLVFTAVYEILSDPTLLMETGGLGPKGWVLGSNKQLKTLIVAIDSEGVKDVSFEFSVDGGPWNTLMLVPDELMSPIEDMIKKLNDIINLINGVIPPGLPKLSSISFSIKIFNAQIDGQPEGHYVMFRANVTDTDGNTSTSPSGFYYVVNESSSTRVLIIDPYVKLWLLQHNLKQLSKMLKDYSNYEIPDSIMRNITIISKISDLINRNGIIPFHHWEKLGKYYNLYIAWPDISVVDILKGGFEPSVIILSNLWLGVNVTGKISPWNWDLRDISILNELIVYIKTKHAGLIVTHGTLSDWIVWTDCSSEKHYKVGSRGHVGEAIEDVNIIFESTIAALLGMPELALWEYVRDQIAYTLCGQYEYLGLLVGSIPIQVPYVPFNGSMKTTIEAKYLDFNIPEEFSILIPSVYNEFNIPAYTQVGWQLVMPRALAYTAWWKAQEMRPQAERVYSKLSRLIENTTQEIYSSENIIQHMNMSLNWTLQSLYRSIISANISDAILSLVINIPNLGNSLTLTFNISNAYDMILQLLPTKLIALSKDGLAGIIVHDKYWSPLGYRAVYFSFEVEAVEDEIAEVLLVNAVEWSLKWQFKDITELLGGKVRVPKELASKFTEALNSLPGNLIESKGLILNEEGYAKIEILANTSGVLHVLIAHPTTSEVKIVILEGLARIINVTNVTEGITQVTIKVNETGKITIGLRSGSQSALNPVYVAVKQEVVAPPQTATITFSALGLSYDASGIVLIVDGVGYTYADLPISFTWEVGSYHSFTWTDLVSAGASKRYVWVSTSGLSDARSGLIIVPSGGGSITASYKTQYYLTIQASPSDGGSVSPSSGWYDAGSLILISATPSPGWTFERWIGYGNGSYSGTRSSVNIIINEPIIEIAYFYTFSISVLPTNGSIIHGRSISTIITVTLIGGYNSSITISFSASGLPPGTSVSFNPDSVTINPSIATAYSNMTILTSTLTPEGLYIITITGLDGGLSKTAIYTLTVLAQTHIVKFYIYDEAGNVISEASLIFAGKTYSHGSTTTVTIGSYPLTTGFIPRGYSFKQWESFGGISIMNTTESSTIATVSGDGYIIMRLTAIPLTAKFEISNLLINPTEANVGEEITISVTVRNIGEREGVYRVNLKINGLDEASKDIKLAPRESTTVTFKVRRDVPGIYNVEVNGLTGRFILKAPLKPAEFRITSLSISPSEVKPGEVVKITINITNVGEETGSYTVKLKVDGAIVDSKTITLSGGESKIVIFEVTRNVVGTYEIEVNGQRGTFTVKEAVTPLTPIKTWLPYIGFVIVIILILALATFLVKKGRKQA